MEELGKEILEEIKNRTDREYDETVYGLNESGGINDFLIDHKKISLKDKSYFFHMLAVMVDAGIPVVQALKSLAPRTANRRFQRVLNTIAHGCSTGATLSDAMSRFYDVFDEGELGIIRSGEATGRLHQMLFRLSDQLNKRHALYVKLWGAAFYPIVVFCILILVAVGMLLFVFPKLLEAFAEGGFGEDALPASTRGLLWVQNLIVNYWWGIMLVVAAIYGLFAVYKGSSGRVKWDYFKLRIPLVGNLLRKVYVLRFVSMLGILIEAGLPVIKALEITGNAIPNSLYKLKVKEVMMEVEGGQRISGSLKDTEFLFPSEVVEMIAVGEKSANLGPISEKIAEQYQREIDNSLKKMTSVFEPLMILFVGVSVALLAMAVMAPIFNLSSAASF